jgi:hypothetical protein
MFISKAEKAKLFEQIAILQVGYNNLTEKYSRQLNTTGKYMVYVQTLEKRVSELEGKKPAPKNTHKTKWTPERRAEQSDRIKKMWADKRKAKLAENTVMGIVV